MATHEETYDALNEALTPLGLDWTIESLMHRLKDVDAFKEED